MKRRSNRYIQAIKRIAGRDDPNEAVEELIAQYRIADESLENIAYRLGVENIVEEPLPFEGGSFHEDGAVIVKLNSLTPKARRRFTLAHEIGHLVIDKSIRGRRDCGENRLLEQACDLIAAELLMPAAAVKHFSSANQLQSPEALKALAHNFDVSLHTASLRVHTDLRLWKRAIGFWRLRDSPQQLWFVGNRPWTDKNQNFDVFEDALKAKVSVKAREFCWHGDGLRAVSLHVLDVGQRHVLGVVSEATF